MANNYYNQKKYKPKPDWYDEYLSEVNLKQTQSKQKIDNQKSDLNELIDFFKSISNSSYKPTPSLIKASENYSKSSNRTSNDSHKLYNKKDYDAKKFTAKERQDYHNACAKKGSTFSNHISGAITVRSDFNRGYHKAQADRIAYERQKAFNNKFKKN